MDAHVLNPKIRITFRGLKTHPVCSLGTAVQQHKTDQMLDRGAQLTSYVLETRGKKNLVFNLWVRHVLENKLSRQQDLLDEEDEKDRHIEDLEQQIVKLQKLRSEH